MARPKKDSTERAERDARIVKLYLSEFDRQQGQCLLTFAEIGERFGVVGSTVREAIRAAGHDPKPRMGQGYANVQGKRKRPAGVKSIAAFKAAAEETVPPGGRGPEDEKPCAAGCGLCRRCRRARSVGTDRPGG